VDLPSATSTGSCSDHGGSAFYLAKDATTTAGAGRAMDPRLEEFQAIKARLDPRGASISSSLARAPSVSVSGA
jgi:hypothetical protein